MPATQLFAPRTLKQELHTVGAATFCMVALPGKKDFWMGSDEKDEGALPSEKPHHQRDIAAFSLAEFPVTQVLWQEVVARAQVQGMLKEQALSPTPSYFPGARRPVESISWDDAQEFCRVLNLLLGKPVGHFRLPSEAEWEYAARTGGRETLYAGSNQLAEVAWSSDNSNEETVPVGLLSPNDFGLYDLSGNVWEWCEDGWHDNYDNPPLDGTAWKDGDTKDERAVLRVLRGGSWSGIAWYCRCAFRSRLRPGSRLRNVGFRLAAPV
jgi:formylglycine-generating enzyme required for sulfatase activity